MIGLLLFLGMLPRESDVVSGPPAPHLGNVPAVQWRLSARASWRAFQGRWGGRWGVRWDPRNATPRFLWAPGIPSVEADALVADVARLAGVDPAELERARVSQSGGRVITQWTRKWRGAPVEGDQVALVATGGRIGAVWVQLTPIRHTEQPRPGERILPTPPKGAPELVRRTEEGGLVVFRDRDGALVHRYDPRLYGSLAHTYEERTVGDPLLTAPTRQVTLTAEDGTVTVTADDGSHILTGPLSAWLDGPTLGVTDNRAELRVAVDPDDTLEAGTDIPYAAATVQHHFHVVWDWLRARWPTHAWLGRRVTADVDGPGSCNAWYSSGTLTFLREEAGVCNDLGRIADVVYHETGHGIHEYILAAGTFASDVSEGSADYVAATILEDAVLAPNAWADGGYIREIETDKVYPVDVVHEVHTDGLIWASFLWNLRAEWGADDADTLFLGALSQGPTLTDVYEAVIVADDDDGDLSNGTPHGCELVELLAHHGLGPGPIGVVRFDHTPLGPQSSWAEGYAVDFVLEDLLPACSGLDEDSVALFYSTNGAAIGDEEGWEQASLASDAEGWHGIIPRQVATTRVRYFMQAQSDDGTQVVRTDGGDEGSVYAFQVGDRRSLWCEDFEGGLGGWTHGVRGSGTVDEFVTGSPSGAATWDPDVPVQGVAHAATVLDGTYAPDNEQHLTSPVISAAGHGPMLTLTYQRWLTVEDALYDRAELWAGDLLAWGNAATETGEAHHLDVAWTRDDLPLEPLLDARDEVRFTWTLRTDAGLEYGGWALDDVCVVELDDVPGHYRVRDLAATDDAEAVVVTWTQPWMTPLAATLLVRGADGYPAGPEDGVILDVEFFPVAGEARSVVDPDAAAGETFFYALFAAGTDGNDWYVGVVEGENADMGGVPEAADTGDSGPDDGADSGVAEDEGPPTDGERTTPACGCANGAGRGSSWLVLAGLILGAHRRARRRPPE